MAVLWIPIALLAHRAVDYLNTGRVDRSYSLVHGFVTANALSLGHYLFAPPSEVLPRINFAIALQVGLATVLLAYTLWLQFRRSPDTLRWARRAWIKNLTIYAAAILILEIIWPSTFDSWWMWWA